MTGVERIRRSFEGRKEGRKCLLAFLTGGDPSLAESERFCRIALEYADILEIGIPFSDPLADGPVIQNSYDRALSSGVRPADVFKLVEKLRRDTDKPMVFLTYVNVLMQKGFERFMDAAAECGIDGLIIPDLPPEEAGKIIGLAAERGLALNFLVAPTSTEARIKAAAEASTGFVYVVSLRGVTGVRKHLAKDLPELVERIRKLTDLPLAVGFGISNPEQAGEVGRVADGVIVGSALVQIAGSDGTPAEREERLALALKGLRGGLQFD